MSTIHFTEIGDCMHVRLGRPDARNALTRDDIARLESIADELAQSEKFEFVIIEGEGKAFCAGMDRFKCGEIFSDAAALKEQIVAGCRLFDKLERLPQTTVALLNGPAVGFGCHLALSFDFRICVTGAYLQLPEGLFGISDIYHFPMLLECLGPDRAMAMILCGEKLVSNVVFSSGLCTACSDEIDQAKVEVQRLVDTLRATPRDVRRTVKQCLTRTKHKGDAALQMAALP